MDTPFEYVKGGPFRKVEEVAGTFAIRTAKIIENLNRFIELIEKTRPVMFQKIRKLTNPYFYDPGYGSQIIDMPVGRCR